MGITVQGEAACSTAGVGDKGLAEGPCVSVTLSPVSHTLPLVCRFRQKCRLNKRKVNKGKGMRRSAFWVITERTSLMPLRLSFTAVTARPQRTAAPQVQFPFGATSPGTQAAEWGQFRHSGGRSFCSADISLCESRERRAPDRRVLAGTARVTDRPVSEQPETSLCAARTLSGQPTEEQRAA